MTVTEPERAALWQKYDLRMLPIAIMAWVSALACTQWPALSRTLLIAAGLILLVLIAVTLLHAPWQKGLIGLAVLTVTVALAPAAVVAAAEPSRSHAATETAGHVVEVTARITSAPKIGADERLWVDAVTEAPAANENTLAHNVPIRVGITADGEQAREVVPGARVTFTAQARTADPGERAVLVFFTRDPVTIEAPRHPIFAFAAHVRETFVERSLRLPRPGASLLPGLAVGDTRAVSPQLNDAMIASGLSHLTAVSGSNCALVTAAMFGLVALVGGGRMLRILVALLALFAFVVLVTFEPSVVRAATMATLAMLTLLVGRPSAGVPMLLLAVAGLLIVDPWIAWSAGFALSVAATAALIVLAPPLARGLERIMPRPLAIAIAVPLSAELACSPIIALFSSQQSFVSVIANLIADLAAPPATVLGLLACLAAPVPLLADLLAASAWLPASWIAMTATVTASLPGSTITVVPGPVTALVVAGVSTALGRLVAGTSKSSRRTRLAGLFAVIVVSIAGGGLIAALLVHGPLAARDRPDQWSIAQCDVGQGDAVLVRSGEQIALIDTGPDAQALERCLGTLDVHHIDLLVLTHFDLDHVAGTSAVEGRVASVIHGPISDPDEQRMLDRLQASGAVIKQVSIGDRGTLGSARWRILWPRLDDRVFAAGNDASVVIEFVDNAGPSLVALGDLAATPQRFLAASGVLQPPYDVVKVAHHGSADQDPGLYAVLRGRISLIGVGDGNRYGHPRPDTLRMLQGLATHTVRSDRAGLALVSRDETTVTLWQERADDVTSGQ
ncbi:ComEC/Rec2 family competence protein [Microbacterium sp. YY-01]|uniref:ComEC/Rec2 family competence protein n=1 Tax=Microbacterium sp. YY-01 TaxID=3421634 RepID=UPI003D166D8C